MAEEEKKLKWKPDGPSPDDGYFKYEYSPERIPLSQKRKPLQQTQQSPPVSPNKPNSQPSTPVIKNKKRRIYENDTKTRKKPHYVRDATNEKCYIVRWYGKSWESTEAEEKGGVLIEAENGIDEYVQRLNDEYSSSFVDLCGGY